MRQVLLAEDSKMFGQLAKKRIEQSLNVSVSWARSYAETETLLAESGGNFSFALLDFNLPDAPQGEVIDLVTAEGITAFVFTGTMNEDVRRQVWGKRVADYILKDDPTSLDSVIAGMRRLEQNQQTLVLVVDESPEVRNTLSELLYVRQYRVLNSPDLASCLKVIDKYPEVRMVVADLNSEVMGAGEFCRKVREKSGAHSVAILGLVDGNDQVEGARALKSGASDFMMKSSLLVEEFYCRISQCLDNVSLHDQLRHLAEYDALTGLLGRKTFLNKGKTIFRRCVKARQPIACVGFAIDHLEEINDFVSMEEGDRLLSLVGTELSGFCREGNLVSRLSGNCFCVLIAPEKNEIAEGDSLDSWARTLVERYEQFCGKIAHLDLQHPVATDGRQSITVSAGLALQLDGSFEELIKATLAQLRQAQRVGGNLVLFG